MSVVAALGLVCGCTPIRNDEIPQAAMERDAAAEPSNGASADSDGGATPPGEPGTDAADGGARPAAGAGGSAAGAGGAASVAGASAPAAGSGGDRATTPAVGATSAIQGKVIDFNQQPVEAVQVTVGATTVTTDASGAFRIEAVTASYDLTLLTSSSGNELLPRHVWRYEGLTRRDPTLQIYVAGAIRSSAIELHIDGVDFSALESGDTTLLSYGGPNGVYNPSGSFAETQRDRISWQGASASRYTAHALRMLKLPDQVEATTFYSHDSQVLDLTDDGEARVDLSVPKDTPVGSHGKVSGTLERPSGGSEAELQVYLQFPDRAWFPLVFDSSNAASFSYAIPNIPGATITMAALVPGDAIRIVHVDGLTADSPAVSLTLPEAPVPVAPDAEATVDGQALFQWTGDAGVFVFRALSLERRDTLQVVTTKREVQLPAAVGFGIPTGREYSWRLETHGSYATVDAATGSTGFLDTCAYYRPTGPARGSGTYAESAERTFTTAP